MVDTVVLHATVLNTASEVCEHFAKPDPGVSAHYTIDRDGTMSGYDLELVRAISLSVDVPVIALGGAGKKDDLVAAYRDGRANGLGAGSLFVYKDKKRGVLINYPEKGDPAFD